MTVLEDYYASRHQTQPEVRKRIDPVLYGNWRERQDQPLSSADLLKYQKNGYLFIQNLFSKDEVRSFLDELERLAELPDRDGRPEYITEPGSGVVRSIFQIHKSSPVFRRLAEDKRIADVARQILDSDVYMHQSRINLKPGFSGKEFYWHSDFETWHVEDGMPRMRALSCSITLTDNYPFNGPLMVIPGSHEHYVVCVGQTPQDHYKISLKKQEYGVPAQEDLRKLVEMGGIEAPTGPAGSVIFFDCNIMHGSNGNITPYPRTNIFFVYNSIENRVVEPFGGLKPRPEFIGAREKIEVIGASGDQ